MTLFLDGDREGSRLDTSESLDHVVDIAMLGSEAGKVCNEGVISMNNEIWFN